MKGVLFLGMLWALRLSALPTEPSPVTENVHVQRSDSSLDVHATEERSILNWHSFSIDTEEQVSFHLPNQESAILNRVTGTETSEILGTLTSNGHVYLLNPHGVVIGKDALIDTASFLTSTLSASDDAFLQKGQLLFEGASTAKIVNLGTIRTQSGDITLLAHHVEQEGEISAQGELYIGAGHRFLLQPKSSPLLQICPEMPAKGVDLKGDIQALSMQVEADGAQQLGIRQSGRAVTLQEKEGRIVLSALKGPVEIAATLKASAIEVEGNSLHLTKEAHCTAENISIAARGEMFSQEGMLLAPGGTISLTAENKRKIDQLGTLDVSGEKAGTISIHAPSLSQHGSLLADGEGGRIEIEVEEAFLAVQKARFSTNHSSRAGVQTISSGGNLFSSATHSSRGEVGGTLHFSGKSIDLSAPVLDVRGDQLGGTISIGERGKTQKLRTNPSTQIFADSSHGKGGTILTWSDDKGDYFGTFSATGEKEGGFVDISAVSPHWNGQVSVESFQGKSGKVLFDPQSVTISSGSGVAPQFELTDPNAGSGSGFGDDFLVLSTGNIVVSKPSDDSGGNTASGAVYVYNGLTGALISTITGSANSDQVGSGGMTALTGNGNFVIFSTQWNGGGTDLGAVTWGDGDTGISGTVSSSNSIIGSTNSDQVGNGGITALTNGNFVISSPNWDNGATSNAGAATWGDGTTGQSATGFGAVSTSNSIVGSTANDQVSSNGITALSNGNFVISSPNWDDGASTDAGAATWGVGTTGQSATGFGAVSTSNSIVGDVGATLGSGGITALTGNGNFVISSPNVTGPTTATGAATWGNGTTGKTGAGSFGLIGISTDSIGGSTLNDQVSSGGITALTNGHFVVSSPNWDNGGTSNAGAATWGDGTTGKMGTGSFGTVSSSNSIVGSTASDAVSDGGITALSNGNFVVSTPLWDNGATANVGAATWGDGTTGQSATGFGAVSSSNSIIGATALSSGDQVSSSGIVALESNGNFVVCSSGWSNVSMGLGNVGAVTWGDGSTGQSATGFGAVSTSNSIVGSTADDNVGRGGSVGSEGIGAVALSNGNFVISSPLWQNGGTSNAGAATWGSGTTGKTASGNFEAVSTSNSIVGSQTNDYVSVNVSADDTTPGIVALTNGNYVVLSSQWNNVAAKVGAVTWCNGTTGQSATGFGALDPDTNSLVGAAANDQISNLFSSSGQGVRATSDGNFFVVSPDWGTSNSQGAVTWGDGTTGKNILGLYNTVSAQNSAVGDAASSGLGNNLIPAYDSTNGSVVAVFETEERVVVNLRTANQLTFARDQEGSMTIVPTLITALLDAGTDVTIQANNDITLSSTLIVNTPPGATLTLTAGRSVTISADITTEGGALSISANEPSAGGVVDTYRTAGTATLTVGTGVTINTAAGDLTLNLKDGTGNTNNTSGDLTLSANSSLQTSSGDISITAADHNIVVAAGAEVLSSAGGDVSLTAGGNIEVD